MTQRILKILSLLQAFLSLQTSSAQYEGSYTVYGEDPDFENILVALELMELEGMSGPVTLHLASGEYLGPLGLGCAPEEALTITSQTGNAEDVTLELTRIVMSNTIISNVTILPRIAQFQGTLYGEMGMRVAGSGLTFDGCIIQGPTDSEDFQTGLWRIASYTGFTVRNCTFRDLEQGINLHWASGTGTSDHDGTQLLENNVFEDVDIGIRIIGSLEDSLLIRENVFLEPMHGISMDASGEWVTHTEIEGNHVVMASDDAIDIRSAHFSLTPGYYRCHIKNNMITAEYNAIDTQGSNGIRFSNNSMVGTVLLSFVTNSYNIKFENNAVRSNGSWCVKIDQSDDFLMQHNAYFNEDPEGSIISGGFGVGSYSDLDLFQAEHNNELGSVVGEPGFANTYDDLHAWSSILSNAALPLEDVTKDFDGDTRDPLSPDIGADEFNYVGVDEYSTVSIRIFPNPASDYIFVAAPMHELGNSFFITDSSGRVVHSGRFSAIHTSVDVSGWNSGVYFVRKDDIQTAGAAFVIR